MTKSCGMRQILRERALDLLTHHAFVRQRIDQTAIADLPALDLRSNRGDLAGGIGPEIHGIGTGKPGMPRPHENIEIVQTYRLAADENVSRADDGIGKFAIDDIFDSALLLDDCSFHLTLVDRGQTGGRLAIETFHSRCQQFDRSGLSTPHDECL